MVAPFRMIDNEKLFNAIRTIKGSALTQSDVDRINAVLTPQTTKRTSQAGIDLIHSFESLRLAAYKDPGSSNGLPITIGWGSTRDEQGRPIKLGDVWTEARANARFAADLADEEAAVAKLAPVTTQGQLDALVSFQYNTGALGKSTLLKRHNAGDYAGARSEFAKWVFNDGTKLNGLVRRRAAEAALYGSA